MSVATNQQPLAPPTSSNQVIEQIALELIVPSPTNPRKSFDQASIDELALSIANVGLLQPITVRPLSADIVLESYANNHGVQYEIVAGERRFRAMSSLGLVSIGCIVREMTDDQVLEAQIVENLQREDVSAIDEAEGFRQLVEKLAVDGTTRTTAVEIVAARIGKSVRHVWSRMKLVNLAPEVKEALAAGRIETSHADVLATLPTDEQKEITKEITSAPQTVSTRELKKKIAATKPAKASKATAFDPKQFSGKELNLPEPKKFEGVTNLAVPNSKRDVFVERALITAIDGKLYEMKFADVERVLDFLAERSVGDAAAWILVSEIAREVGLDPKKVRANACSQYLASLADPKPPAKKAAAKKSAKKVSSPTVKATAAPKKTTTKTAAKSKPAKKSAAKSATGVSKDAPARVGSKSKVTRNATQAKGGR